MKHDIIIIILLLITSMVIIILLCAKQVLFKLKTIMHTRYGSNREGKCSNHV